MAHHETNRIPSTDGQYSYKLHGSARPISMKSDVIRKRARHDARRGSGNGSSETPPSASPGASRRASPNAESTPTLAPDSSTQLTYNDNGNGNGTFDADPIWEVPLFEDQQRGEAPQEGRRDERNREPPPGLVGKIMVLLGYAGPNAQGQRAFVSLVFAELWWLIQVRMIS